MALDKKYQFDEKLLKDYTPSVGLPGITRSFHGRVVDDPTHPYAGFIRFYIDNVVNQDFSHDLVQRAFHEMYYRNAQAGVPEIAPTEEEMVRLHYQGAINELEEYIASIRLAVSTATAKGIPQDKWPLEMLIQLSKDLGVRRKRIADLEGRSSLIIFTMGN